MKIKLWLQSLPWRLLFVAAFFIPTQSSAQPTLLSDYFIETWNSNNGLPHNSVNAIAQTEDGYLWFATWEGVARYNGLEFKLFDRSRTTYMLDSGSRALTAEQGNRLWVGGARGSFTLRQGATWFGQDAAPSLVNHIYQDENKNLWLAIQDKGLVYRPYLGDGEYDQEQWLLQDLTAFRITQGRSGKILVATEQGLYRLQGMTPELITTPEFKRVQYLSRANNGDLLLGTDNGAWRWDGPSLNEIDSALRNISVTVIEEDSSGCVWIGTVNNGVARYSQVGLEFFDASKGLPNNRIISWFQDMEGGIWIGTNGGVIRLREAPVVAITTRQGLAGNYVRSVLDLDEQHLLVGSSNGLSVVNSQTGYSAEVISDSISVLSLAAMQSKQILVGTYQHGVLRYHDGELTPEFDQRNGLPVNEVRAILQDSKGNLWFGTPVGLVRVSPDNIIDHFTNEQGGLNGSYVMSLTEDEFGNIWVGTGTGVSYFDGEQFVSLNLAELEQAQYAFGFYVEAGFVWIATDRGIIRYRQSNGEMALVGRPQGLPIDKFFQVVKDDKGYFWLTSNRGIWRISYQAAHQIADGDTTPIEFEHYDQNDGMASSQANGGSNPAAVKTQDGTLYFATANGVAAINSERLTSASQYRFPVVLESVSFDSQNVNRDELGQAPAGTHRVVFDYVGLGFVMPDRLQYRTKLQGFDSDWVYRGNATIAEYTNLPPGDYQLMLSARYPYSEWQDNKPLYRFTVAPQFWQRLDVRLAAFVVIIFAIALLVRFRIHKLEKNEHKLKALVEAQTKELRKQAKDYERLSKEDALSRLPNRRAFDIHLNETFNRARSNREEFYVAILDIDYFKKINDRYSHIIGDKAVVAIAETLAEYVGDRSKVARWGGEEFTIMYNGKYVYDYFDALRQRIEQSDFSHVAEDLVLTVSIGVSTNQGSDNYEQVVKQADHALLQAKRSGRNRVEIYAENEQ